jgi:hypothetical protein
LEIARYSVGGWPSHPICEARLKPCPTKIDSTELRVYGAKLDRERIAHRPSTRVTM